MNLLNPMMLLSWLSVVACHSGPKSAFEAGADATVASVPLQVDLKKWLIGAGFIVDFSEQAAGQRTQWLSHHADKITASAGTYEEVPGAVGCAIQMTHQGRNERIELSDTHSVPHPNGRVMYCDKNRLFYAPSDPMAPKLLQELGVSPSELAGVAFYRVPTPVTNAWATVIDGNAIVVSYDGLSAAARRLGLHEKSVVGMVLGHELGHIVDSRKIGFANLMQSRERVIEQCVSRLQNLPESSVTYSVRMESCRRDIASNSRTYEYSADNFAVSIVARKKYPSDIDPYALVDFKKKALGVTSYNPFGSHPPGPERALQFERSLERAGITRKK